MYIVSIFHSLWLAIIAGLMSSFTRRVWLLEQCLIGG